MPELMPRYPVYIPSKGRFDECLTARMFDNDSVPFRLVVEKQEYEAYASRFGKDRVLVLPFANLGSVIPARNWIKEHSIAEGHASHWQFDDNIRGCYRGYRKQRIPMTSGVALKIIEDFVDRYTNIAVAGLNYTFFAHGNVPPFFLNCHVYSCTLIRNEIPHRWRGRYNEDTDLCLQVLADGWCTVLFNAFSAHKALTMTMKGGNTDELYSKSDGRLKMARALERAWPGVVETKRRFKRPQHVVKDAWRKFDTPLKRKTNIDWDNFKPNEYGMRLKQVKEIKSETIRKLLSPENEANS